MKMRRFIGAAAAMAVAGTLTVGASAESYNAYIGFQTAPYSFRNSFDDATYGKDVALLAAGAVVVAKKRK